MRWIGFGFDDLIYKSLRVADMFLLSHKAGDEKLLWYPQNGEAIGLICRRAGRAGWIFCSGECCDDKVH